MTPLPEILAPCHCGDPNCGINFGECHCGCGRKTSVATKSHAAIRMVRGLPMLYVVGHGGRQPRASSRLVAIDGIEYRTIALTQGQETIVDIQDYDWLNRHSWFAFKVQTKTGWYAATDLRLGHRKKRTIFMHGLVCPVPSGYETDHIDGNGLHNWRANLRPSKHVQNLWNTGKARTNTSGFKGAFYQRHINRWTSHIRANNKVHYLGCFKTREEAAAAYAEAAVRLHGDFRRLTG